MIVIVDFASLVDLKDLMAEGRATLVLHSAFLGDFFSTVQLGDVETAFKFGLGLPAGEESGA